MTSAVTRLAVLFVAPEKDVTPGCVAFSVGPYCLHACPLAPGSPFLASFLAIVLNVVSALAAIAGGMAFAGYARSAARYASNPAAGVACAESGSPLASFVP